MTDKQEDPTTNKEKETADETDSAKNPKSKVEKQLETLADELRKIREEYWGRIPDDTKEPSTKGGTKPLHAFHFPYDFVPATEKACGCCSQRRGCIVIGVAQIIAGSCAAGLQVMVVLLTKGGIDLTWFFGVFPKDESVKKFFMGVSVVDIIAKVVFIISGIIIIIGAVKENPDFLSSYMCISSLTFSSSIATNAATAGGMLSFVDSREELALPLTFEALLMVAQYYVMTVVKGYLKHLEKARDQLRNKMLGPRALQGQKADDHDVVHERIIFRCCKCCAYEENLQKLRGIENAQIWGMAERERRRSLKAQVAEIERRRLMERATEAERLVRDLLQRQAVLEERERTRQLEWQRQRGSTLPQSRRQWPKAPMPTGQRNMRPGQSPGISRQNQEPFQHPSRKYRPTIQPPSMPNERSTQPSLRQSQPKPFPQYRNKRRIPPTNMEQGQSSQRDFGALREQDKRIPTFDKNETSTNPQTRKQLRRPKPSSTSIPKSRTRQSSVDLEWQTPSEENEIEMNQNGNPQTPAEKATMKRHNK